MGKGKAPCCDRNAVKKGTWTAEEDARLISFIERHGHGNWRALPNQAGLQRCGKSCRLRWINYLRPGLRRGNFTREEEEIIIRLQRALGNKWTKIASFLPGRTDNEIKNVWNTVLKKRELWKKKYLGVAHNGKEYPIEYAGMTTSTSYSSSVEEPDPGTVHQNRAFPMNVNSTELSGVLSGYRKVEENLISFFPSDHNTNGWMSGKDTHKTFKACSQPSNAYDFVSNKKQPDSFDIPLEFDADFWNLFDDLDSSARRHRSVHFFEMEEAQIGNVITLTPDNQDWIQKWLDYFDTEPRLEDPSKSDIATIQEPPDAMDFHSQIQYHPNGKL